MEQLQKKRLEEFILAGDSQPDFKFIDYFLLLGSEVLIDDIYEASLFTSSFRMIQRADPAGNFDLIKVVTSDNYNRQVKMIQQETELYKSLTDLLLNNKP